MANTQRDLQDQLRRLGYKVDKSAARLRGEAEVLNQIKAGVDAMNGYLDDEDFRTNLEEYHRTYVEKWLTERKRLDERGIIQERPSVAASGGRRDERRDGESDGARRVREGGEEQGEDANQPDDRERDQAGGASGGRLWGSGRGETKEGTEPGGGAE